MEHKDVNVWVALVKLFHAWLKFMTLIKPEIVCFLPLIENVFDC